MEKQWLIFDMSSIGWQNLLAGKDREHGQQVPHPKDPSKTVLINSAEYGFENFVDNLTKHLARFNATPRDIIMVPEGKNSKTLRQSISADYKAGRDHPEESYAQFVKLQEKMQDTLLGMGALAVWQDGVEADDVICYLTQNLKSKHTVVSNDGDLLVLVKPGTDVYSTGRDETNENKYGPFSHRFITLYKALVGDTSDRIKGAKGFGEKAFIELLCTFREEGLEAMEELIVTRELGRLVEDVADLKLLQRIIDDQEGVYTSWALARMYPEKVNTMRSPLQCKAGMVRQWDPKVHDPRLKGWYGFTRIIHAENYEAAKAWALEKLLESPEVPLDIETSTPPESDEWLEAKKRNAGGEEGAKLGVDVLGSRLTGLSLCIGRNLQYSFYLPVDHVETPTVKNLTSEQVRQFVELIPDSKPTVVQNASFELSVLYQEWCKEWANNGWHGFLPNVYDTKIMKSYVDENGTLKLKEMSKEILGYDQVSYAEVTRGDTVKMNQLTAEEVVAYGCDDSICTGALFNYFRFWMEIEGTMPIYEEVERLPAYLNALRFVQGTPISLEKMHELEKEDEKKWIEAWTFVRDFLIRSGWEGTVCPKFEGKESFTPAAIKEAYTICNNGAVLETMVRTPSKLFKLIAEQEGGELLAQLMTTAYETGDCEGLNDLLKINFSGEPMFKADSPKNMQTLLYKTLALPVRLRNKPTEIMRKQGIKEGNPKADDFALEFAIKYDADRGDEVVRVLKSIQTMRVMDTRRKLYYVPYRNVRHWKDNLVHSHLNQCSTVTRRYSDADPNKQALGKNVKHGHKPRIREVYIPHKKDAVVVSVDFGGQELRGIAEQSQDPNMLACFVGDNKKDMHALTASEIMRKKPLKEMVSLVPGLAPGLNDGWIVAETGAVWDAALAYARWKGCSYEAFYAALKDETHPDNKLCKELRQIGKKVNFTTEYGAQAQKLSETLIITPEEAQIYIDAKEAAFPVASAWKEEVIKEAHRLGYQTTMMGARRHLRDALNSSNRFDASKAERQAVNFKIQGSAAEQTKLAEARMWAEGIYFKYDARYIGPVHDELVSSCAVKDLIPFLRDKHRIMTSDYAGMKVPIIASISFGPSYGEQIEVSDDEGNFDLERIVKALQSLGYDASMTLA